MQLKQDVHRFINKNKEYSQLASKFEDDSMDYTNNKETVKYFNGQGIFSIGDSDDDLYIKISLENLTSKYSPQIKFDFITNVIKPNKDSSKKIEFTEDENLINFMNDWESYSWKSLFNGFIRHVKSELNIKSNKSDNIDWDSMELPDDINELIKKIYELDNSKPQNLEEFVNQLIAKANISSKFSGDYSKLVAQIIESNYNENIESKLKIKAAILNIDGKEAEELIKSIKSLEVTKQS